MPMTHRLLPLLAALLASVGAAPPPFPPITLTTQQPPSDSGQALGSPYTPAPVPNLDLERPGQTAARAQTELSPGIYRPNQSYRGDGFTPGSTVQGEEQRHYKPLPSLNLTVPLE